MLYKEKAPQERVVEMLRVGVHDLHIVVSRLCSEFAASFWVQGDSIWIEQPDVTGKMQKRCIYNSYS